MVDKAVNRYITISIHSPRMGRDSRRIWREAGRVISIHSPRMGRDNTAR